MRGVRSLLSTVGVALALALIAALAAQAYGTTVGTAEAARWGGRADLRICRDSFGTATFGDRLYAFGGMSGARGTALSSVEVYDPAGDRWRSGPQLPLERHSMGTALVGDAIYLVGGSTEQGVTDRVERFRPARGSYDQAAPLPAPRL